MKIKTLNKIEYIIVDPTKNITALVISKVSIIDQAKVAKAIMSVEKEVEQVGFVSYGDNADITLRMSGGEFCGNATMSIAIYHAIKNNLDKAHIKVCVLDTEDIINVAVEKMEDDTWRCRETIPYEPKITYIDIDDYRSLPLVSLDGISHIIFGDAGEKLQSIKTNLQFSGPDIKKWCESLSLPAIGFMFYDESESKLIPYVYVRESDTLFWENACASGTIAIGAYLAEKYQKNINQTIHEPGGTMNISKNEDGKLVLEGKVKILV